MPLGAALAIFHAAERRAATILVTALKGEMSRGAREAALPSRFERQEAQRAFHRPNNHREIESGTMKGFTRNNPYFSLCGLNCKLCSMNISGHCGGCGFGNQSYPIARCSLEHGKPEYCFQCPEYPCERYERIDELDSFITHRNQKTDMEKFQLMGEDAYKAEQVEKRQILDRLLAEYDDGRKKTLFCLAVNLLPLDDLRTAFEDGDLDLPLKERAKLMERRLRERSDAELKLRRKK